MSAEAATCFFSSLVCWDVPGDVVDAKGSVMCLRLQNEVPAQEYAPEISHRTTRSICLHENSPELRPIMVADHDFLVLVCVFFCFLFLGLID